MVMVNQNVLSGYNGEVSCGWDHELSSTADLSFTLKVMKESLKDFKQGSDRTRVCFNEHTVMGQRELGRDWVTAAMYQWICLSSTHLGLMQDSGPEQPWPGPQHLPLARSTARMLAAFFFNNLFLSLQNRFPNIYDSTENSIMNYHAPIFQSPFS